MDLSTVSVYAESSVYTEEIQDLIDKVRRKIQDDSYTAAEIIDLFNQCLAELAGEFLLPNLEAYAIVNTRTGQSYTELPADYHRNIRDCYSNALKRRIRIFGSKSQLERNFSYRDLTGRVYAVAPKGRYLHYQHTPQSPEALEINYWRFPDRISSHSQRPDALPPHLCEPLLVAYAVKELFAEIEDGIEGNQVNTQRWENRWLLLKGQLLAFIGPEESIPDDFDSDFDWDFLVNA